MAVQLQARAWVQAAMKTPAPILTLLPAAAQALVDTVAETGNRVKDRKEIVAHRQIGF